MTSITGFISFQVKVKGVSSVWLNKLNGLTFLSKISVNITTLTNYSLCHYNYCIAASVNTSLLCDNALLCKISILLSERYLVFFMSI